MQQIIEFLVRMLKKHSWLAILTALLLALVMRLPDVGLLKCNYLSDCGRDLLAAKHIAEGTASLWTSPPSAISFLPNTPFYYLILAGLYRLGGLIAISYFNLMVGILVVWFAHQIIMELTHDKVLSFITAVFMAVLPDLISASVTTWQPHWQLMLGGCSIWLCLKALRAKNLVWHYAATASLWPLIYLEYLALPMAAIMTIWLAWSGWINSRLQKSGIKKFGLLITLTVTWIAWMLLVIWLNPIDGYAEFKNLVSKQNFSVSIAVTKTAALAKIFVHFFSDSSYYFGLWVWMLPVPILAALYHWRTTRGQAKKITLGFFLSLLLPIVLVYVDPGASVNGWHFLLQQYVFLLCLILMPFFLRFSRLAQVSFLVALLSVLLYQNRFRLDHSFTDQEPMFQHVEVLARFIAKDVRAESIESTQFSLVHRNEQKPDWMQIERVNDLKVLAFNYATAGVQLALEIQDPRFVSRVTVVPLRQRWSNYVQPFSQTYYVICSNYALETVDGCVDDLFLTNYVIAQKTYLGIAQVLPTGPVFMYRLRLSPK